MMARGFVLYSGMIMGLFSGEIDAMERERPQNQANIKGPEKKEILQPPAVIKDQPKKEILQNLTVIKAPPPKEIPQNQKSIENPQKKEKPQSPRDIKDQAKRDNPQSPRIVEIQPKKETTQPSRIINTQERLKKLTRMKDQETVNVLDLKLVCEAPLEWNYKQQLSLSNMTYNESKMGKKKVLRIDLSPPFKNPRDEIMSSLPIIGPSIKIDEFVELNIINIVPDFKILCFTDLYLPIGTSDLLYVFRNFYPNIAHVIFETRYCKGVYQYCNKKTALFLHHLCAIGMTLYCYDFVPLQKRATL